MILPEFLLSQTVLIDSLQEGGFNLGPTFADNGWSLVNGTATNAWYVGATPSGFTGNCAYISNNGGASWSYTNNTSAKTVHFYRNVVLPQGINYMELSFSWINIGEVAPNDVLMVSIAPTTYTPSQTNTTAVILSKPAETLAVLNNQGTVKRQKIYFSPQVVNTCTSSDSFRIIFSFRYNSSQGNNPPAAIDNISLILHSSPISISGGEFSVDLSQPDGPFNFSSLSKAIVASNAASQCVMTDSIILNIPGDQIFAEDLPWITYKGSANATLKIRQSTGGNRPIVRPFGSSWNRDFGIGLSGASYVDIENIDVRVDPANTNVEYGYFIKPQDAVKGSQYNKFIDATIVLNKNNPNSFGILQTTNSSIVGFSVSNQSGSNSWNEYKGINCQNTAQGVSLQGTSATYYDEGNKIASSISEQMIIGGESENDIGGAFEVSGIYANFQKNLNIEGAVVRNIFTNGAFALYGIRIVDCTGTIILNRNNVNRLKNISTTTYGFVTGVFTSGSVATTVYKLTNNFISDLATMYMSGYNTQFVTGCYLNHTGSTNFVYYNSIVIAPSPNLSSAAMYSVLGQTYLKNNVLINNSYGNNNINHRYSLHLGSSTLTESNYNCLKADLSGLNSFLVKSSAGINYSNLNAWRTASGKDLNSIELNPDFVSSTDLHIQSNSFKIDRKGIHVPGIYYDIDGLTRDTLSPDIGADDHKPMSNGIDIGVYNIAGIDNLDCFGTNEQVSIKLTNTGVNTHDFTLNPIEIQLIYTGAYSGMVNYIVNGGILNSYQDTSVLIPNYFNFSGGGSISFACNVVSQSDVNPLNNSFTKIFNQEPVLQSLSENFNQLSALPANWTFASGWTINTQPGTLSKSLSILLNTNSSSEFILPVNGPITAQDTFSFDLMAIGSGSWNSTQISVSTDCGNSYLPFDTMQSSEYPNIVKWHHYRKSLSNFIGSNVKIKLKVNSSAYQTIAMDNINVDICATPDPPTNLVLTPININSISLSFNPSGADGYLVVRYPAGTLPSLFPEGGVVYSINTALGNGTIISSGVSTNISVTGLGIATAYDFYIFPYFGINCAGGPKYNTINPVWGSQSTFSCSGSGIIRIGSSNDDYTTVAAAWLNLKNIGVLDTVYLELQADYIPETNFTFSSIGCADSSHLIVIRPAANVPGPISSIAPTGSINSNLVFNAVKGLVIDGRPGGVGNENYLKFIANNAPTALFNSGNNFVELRYLDFQGSLTSSYDGIVTLNSSQNITIEKCTIGNSITFVPILLGISSSSNVRIKNNNFTNFKVNGIILSSTTSCLISGNSFYYLTPYNTSLIGVTAIKSSINNSLTIINNFIGGSAASCQGNKMMLNNTSVSGSNGVYFAGIDVSGGINKDSIANNKIQNIKIFSGPGTSYFYGVKSQTSSRYINNNIIGSDVDTSSIIIDMPNSSAIYYFYAIWNYNSSTPYHPDICIKKNIIANIKCDFQSTMDFYFRGIYLYADSDDPSSFIDSNIINNIESAAYGFNYGIYCKKTYLTVFYPQYNSISGNKINGLSFKTAPFMGIYHDSNNYYTLIDNNSISNILVGDSTLNSINSFKDFIGIQSRGRTVLSGNTISDIKYFSQWNRAVDMTGLEVSAGLNVPEPYSARNNLVFNLSNLSTSLDSRITGIHMVSSYFKLINNRVFLNTDSSPVTKIYGIRSVPGYKYVQNNSIFINGTRNNEIPASCIYFEDEVASGNVSNNIFANLCLSSSAKHSFFCIEGISTTIGNNNLSLSSNIYHFNPLYGGICRFPGFIINTMPQHLQLFPSDSTSFYADPLFTVDSFLQIPAKGSIVEGAGSSQDFSYDCFQNDRSLLSPHDIGAVAGDFFDNNLDLSIKSRIKSLACDSIKVYIHLKNQSSNTFNFTNTPGRIELINEGEIHSSSIEIELGNLILNPFQEDTFICVLPILSSNETARIKTQIICSQDNRPENNTHFVEYDAFLPGSKLTVGKDGDFQTLSDAVSFYNYSKCLENDVTFILIDSVYDEHTENFPIVFNRSNVLDSINLKIVSKTGLKVKIQSLSDLSSPLMLFKSNQYIELNSIDTVGPSTLFIQSASTSQPCLHIMSRMDQFKLNNIVIKGNNQSNFGLVRLDSLSLNKSKLYFDKCYFAPYNVSGVLYALSLNISTNRNNGFMQIRNCTFKDYLSSAVYAPSCRWDSIFIENNYFISDKPKTNTLHPIHIGYAGKARILNNFISNHRTSGIYRGIFINEVSNAHISKNIIANLSMPGTNSNLTGIHLGFGQNLTLDNNMISLNWTGSQSTTIQGVFCDIVPTCSLVNNTILLSGSTPNTTSTYALSINNTNILGYLRNNLLFNNTTSSTGQRIAFRYNIPSTLDSDYNVFIGKGTTAENIFLHNGVYYDMAGWQAQSFQPDIHSYSHTIGNAGGGLLSDYFQSPSNLHLITGNNNAKNKGIYLPDFNTDIDNNERLALGVDIGADEFTDSCSVGFVSMISIQDSFFCNGDEAIVFSDASNSGQMGQNYKWQYSFDLNGPFLDIINRTYNFDSLLWKVNLADTIYLRLFSVCNITGLDTFSNTVSVYRQSNSIFAQLDSVYGSLRKGIECAEFGDTLWIEPVLDTIFLANEVLFEKKVTIVDELSPYVKVLNQIQNIAVDQNLDIRRSGNVSLIGMQFEGGGNFYPIIKNSGNLSLYNVILKNNLQKLKNQPYSKIFIEGQVKILD